MSEESNDRQSRNLLDNLFEEVRSFRHAKEVRDLFFYCAKMRHLSAYNAALVYTQMPGNQLVLSAKQWDSEKRILKPNARPLIILLPFGPVGFVYDISDTLPKNKTNAELQKQRLIDKYINQPFQTEHNDLFRFDDIKYHLAYNMPFYGIVAEYMDSGNSIAANIKYFDGASVQVIVKNEKMSFDSRYWVGINIKLDAAQQIASLCHELGHLFCHHLYAPSSWYKRRQLSTKSEEFEAEATAFLVCSRLGIHTRSIEYLAGYKDNDEIPPVSFENIFRAANIIEKMLSSKLTYKDGYLYKYDKTFKFLADELAAKQANRRR